MHDQDNVKLSKNLSSPNWIGILSQTGNWLYFYLIFGPPMSENNQNGQEFRSTTALSLENCKKILTKSHFLKKCDQILYFFLVLSKIFVLKSRLASPLFCLFELFCNFRLYFRDNNPFALLVYFRLYC